MSSGYFHPYILRGDKWHWLAKSEKSLGTRSFKPISSNALEMRQVSLDLIFTLIEYKKFGKSTLHESFVPGKYFACIYDEKWYLVLIRECSHENQDVRGQFTKQNGLILYWFEDDHRNQSWISLQHIISSVEVSIPHGSSSRKYYLS